MIRSLAYVASLACLLTVTTVHAATPQGSATPVAAPAADTAAQPGIIKIGNTYCPAVPENSASDKTKQTLMLVSTTCVMEASGLITHDEARGVYEQALGNISQALAGIDMSDTAPALASK